VLDRLMRQLLIFIFKYLSGILLSVDNVLQIVSDAFSWSTRASRFKKAQEHMSDYCKVPSISTRQANCGIPLFFWHNDLFFRIKSSLFACISCTSLWY
jgi:hypothetical protein